jgi:subtilisin family serine protease
MNRTTTRALVACATMAISVTVTPAAAGDSKDFPQPQDKHVVTLITGDRVAVVSGRERKVVIEPGPGRTGMQFLQKTSGRDRLQVIPVDAAPLLASGRLDPRLFDVTGLIQSGFDDKTRSDLPMIVSYPQGVAVPAAHRILPSINGAAVRAPKDGTFWPAAKTMDKVWLDGRIKLADELSNGQIGVPTAWQAGLRGRGVTVAVLDSGYDATHPDLAGVVTAARDFTGSGSPADEIGHGTHVAGIIAGTASGGRFPGVAPESRLVIGRVCQTDFCEESAVLAGMEWAATEQRAKVINMSLGSPIGSNGTDPLSTALNNLTASTGSLFVVAAGNTAGPVGAPGAADAALTVASVGRTDALSGFSSRGPRIGDFAVKPDIAAPGENIIAARAAGTALGDPVDEHYTSLSGTSMAAPHVAGAAAILAQQHPDWPAALLKAALMSTAKPIDATVYGQGAGRVDVARAVTQKVTAEPASLSFGFLRWPFAGGSPVRKTVTYRNDGEAPVTLNLAVESSAPASAFTLNSNTILVPARGSADVTLTEHPNALSIGSFSGRLVATGPDDIAVQTAFGVTTEQEAYDVTATLTDRNGKPAGGPMPAFLDFTPLDESVDDPGPPNVVDGLATIRVPKGSYGISSVILSETPGKPGLADASGTIAAVPRLVVDRPGIALTFDARRARKVDAVVDTPGTTRLETQAFVQFMIATSSGPFPSTVSVIGGERNETFAIPVRGDARTFAFGFQIIRTLRDVTYFLAIPTLGQIPANPRFRVRDHDLHRSNVSYHAQGVDAALADRVEFPFYLPGQSVSSTSPVPVDLPSRRVEFRSPGVRWSGHIFHQYLAEGPKVFFEGSIGLPDAVYRGGRSVHQEWNNAVSAASLSAPANELLREGNTLQSRVSSFSPGDTGHTGNAVSELFYIDGSATLSRDGAVIDTSPFPSIAAFTVPDDTGRYTLTLVANRARNWTALSTRVTTAWTFTSGPTDELLPVPTVKATGDFDGSSRAAAGRPFTLLLTAATQTGATPSAIRALSVEFSADDGTTWTPASVSRDRGVWKARLTNPANGFVSLRIKASNAAGNSIEQTIIRAYGLR